MSIEGDKSHLTSDSILAAVKDELCFVSPLCGKQFEALIESRTVDVTDLSGSSDGKL